MRTKCFSCLYVMLIFMLIVSAGCKSKPKVKEHAKTEPVVEPVKQPTENRRPPVVRNIPAPHQDDTEDAGREREIPSTHSMDVGFDFEDIHFEYDKHNLTARARNILEKNGNFLINNPGVRISIEGHADDRGSEAYNLSLGQKRAQTTLDYLAALGVPGRNLRSISYGEEMPVDPRQSEAAWAKNRRAHFKVTAR